MRFRIWTIAVLALTVAVLASCAIGTPPPVSTSTAPAGSTPTVTLQDDAFEPRRLTVVAGTSVVWEFDDGPRAHNIVAEGFSSDTKADGTFEHRFDEPGTYPYSCTIHAGMDGTIHVEPSG